MQKIKLFILTLLLTFIIPSTGFTATYYVKNGDSLYKIGQNFGVSTSYLQKNNSLNSTTIYPGQKLWVPDSNGYNYTVKYGDSLYKISQKTSISIANIKSANNLNSNSIYQGQILFIPTNSISSSNTPSRGDGTSNNTTPTGKVTPEELDLLAKIVYGEARGESYKGQVAVASVVLNRVKSSEFSNTVYGVIFEPNAFTAIVDGQFYLTPNETAYNAVKEALSGYDPTYGCIFYYNPAKTTNKFMLSRSIVIRIGSHVFTR